MVMLSREELIKQNALLHRQHILHGYPKGQRPKISKNGFHIDHIKPLAKGGNNEDSNLTVSCRECNLSKHTQTVRPIYARGEYVGTID